MTDTSWISKQIAELDAELRSTPAYQKLLILKEAEEKLAAVDANTASGSFSTHTRVRQAKDFGGPKGRVSVLAAAHAAIKAAGHPLTTNELMILIPRYGAESGGSDPKKNLVSQLSGNKTPLSKELESVRWNGQHAWWFGGRPLPQKNTAGADQSIPAASSTSNIGGPNGTALNYPPPT